VHTVEEGERTRRKSELYMDLEENNLWSFEIYVSQ
jgi:hypothetical protein